jgi:hypothetical protein
MAWLGCDANATIHKAIVLQFRKTLACLLNSPDLSPGFTQSVIEGALSIARNVDVADNLRIGVCVVNLGTVTIK